VIFILIIFIEKNSVLLSFLFTENNFIRNFAASHSIDGDDI